MVEYLALDNYCVEVKVFFLEWIQSSLLSSATQNRVRTPRIQVKAYLQTHKLRLKFFRKSVILLRFWMCCLSRKNFKWNPWLLMIFAIILAQNKYYIKLAITYLAVASII